LPREYREAIGLFDRSFLGIPYIFVIHDREFLQSFYWSDRHLNCFNDSLKSQKSVMIRIDYQAARDSKSHNDHIDSGLLKKAQGFFGKAAREQILQILDSALRLQSGEIAQRLVTPQSLHAVGQQAALEAIKLYRIGQKESFREFAMIYTRQAMVLARNSMSVPDPHAPRPDLPPQQF
jgi:hypothetical protein